MVPTCMKIVVGMWHHYLAQAPPHQFLYQIHQLRGWVPLTDASWSQHEHLHNENKVKLLLKTNNFFSTHYPLA
jgi:hypothetical protein